MSFQENEPIQTDSHRHEEIPVSLEQRVEIDKRIREMEERIDKKASVGQMKYAPEGWRAVYYRQELIDLMPHQELREFMPKVSKEVRSTLVGERAGKFERLLLLEIRHQITLQVVNHFVDEDRPFGMQEDVPEQLQTANPETIMEEIRRQDKKKRVARTIFRPLRRLQKG